MGISKRSLRITTQLLLATLLGVMAFGYVPATTATAAGTPDLIIFDISPLPENPSIGDSVTITIIVKNQGDGPAGQSRLDIDVDGGSLDAATLGPIETGATVARTFTWTATIGTHTFMAAADADSQVTESIEANNAKTFTLSTLAPDLIVQSITWEPTDPSRGDSIAFEVTVKNQGSGRSQVSRVNLFVDGNSRGYKDIPALNGGTTATIGYSWVATAGQHQVRALADEEQNIEETNENNNTLTATFSTLAPDLLVDWVTWEPQNPSFNDDVTFTINVKNQGDGRADACNAVHYLDDYLLQTDYLPALDPGESANLTLDYFIMSNFAGIKTIVDSNQSVVESSEENNEYMTNLTTLQPDLVVKDISWTPEDAAVGDTVTVKVIVKNQGAGDAAASRLACYIGSEYQGYANVAALDAGNSTTISFSWAAQGGTHRIKAHVDFNDDIEESNDTNNTNEADFFIIPPDLVIRDLTWEPEIFSLGDSVDFTLTIANEGGGAAQNFHTSYYLDGKLINAHYTSSLASDTAANITFSWTAELGKHDFIAVTDANHAVIEHLEDNNEYSITITPAAPDLTVEKISWSPGEITAGDMVTVSVTIKNSGTDRAVPFRNTYYIDGSIAGYQDVQELQAGETASQNILWTAAAGLHTIRIVLDSDNRVTEDNENNNVRTVYFPPPDLIIQEVDIAPQGAAVGEPVTITITMRNQGSGKAIAPSAAYFVNGEFGDSVEFPDMEPGAVLTRTITWLAGAGPCNITVAADAAKVVMESDETNNERSLQYGTLTADLTVEDIVCTQGNPKNNNDITFGVVIRNQGDYAADMSRAALYIDGKRVGEHETSAIPAGEAFTENFQIVVESGEHTIRAVADATGMVPEIDESNNEYEKVYSTFTPDLTVDGLKWSPTEAMAGDSVVFTVPVKNQGSAAAENIHVVLFIDGEKIGDHDILKIARGETITKTFNWEALPGSHEISVMLDMDNRVVESNEDNNNEVRTLALPEAPGASPPPTPSQGGGLLDDLWWLLYVTALVFGGIAFYAVLRTAKKGPK